MRLNQWRIVWVLTVLVVSGFEPWAVAEELYLGVNHRELFTRCGIEVKAASIGTAADGQAPSAGYSFGEPVTTYAGEVAYRHGYSSHASVGVYTTIDEARRVFQYWKMILPVRPPPPPEGEPIGDEMLWSGPGNGASIRFRRRNIVFCLREWRSPSSQVVERARQIDALIRDDREIAPLGTFAETPDIVGFPETLHVRPMTRLTSDGRSLPDVFAGLPMAWIRIQPQFRGLGPVENIWFGVGIEGVGSNQQSSPPTAEEAARPVTLPEGTWVYTPDESGTSARPVRPSAENDGRFILELRIPSEPKTTKAKLLAVNEDNLIVTKEVTVTVVPEP